MKVSQPREGHFLPARREASLRAGVIAGTLLIAAGIGLRYASRLPKLLGLAVLGLMSLVLALQHLPWAVIALIPVSFLVDIPIGTGTNVALNATFLMATFLLGVWVLRMLVVDRQIRLAPSPANLPALLFIAACTLAWLISFLPWVPLASGKPSLPAQMGAYLLYVISMGAFLLAINTLRSVRLVKIFTWTYIAFGTVYLLVQVIPWTFNYVTAWFVDGQFGSSVYWTLLATFSMGQALFNRDLSRKLRGGALAIALLVVIFGLLKRPEWISGWLPPLLAMLILVWLWDWRVGAMVTVGGALVALPLLSGFYAARIDTDTQQWSSYSRFLTWAIVFKLIKINPLTGLGPANYAYYTALYSIIGYFVQFNTHNNYFDIILQTGFFGLGMFVWLAAVILRTGWKLRGQARDGFSRAFANAALAGFIAVLFSGGVADWFLPFVYNIGFPGFQASIYVWLFMGGLISLAGLVKQNG